jgi:predicted nucleic acid-binding protein
MKRLLLDTCVLVDYLRNHAPAVEFISQLDDPPAISAMTVAELYVGVRHRREQARVESLMARLRVVATSADVARQGGIFRRDYRQSHGLDLIDALIAATARVHGARLVTRNARHFPMLDDLLVPYR